MRFRKFIDLLSTIILDVLLWTPCGLYHILHHKHNAYILHKKQAHLL